jgi:hypothetical protein
VPILRACKLESFQERFHVNYELKHNDSGIYAVSHIRVEKDDSPETLVCDSINKILKNLFAMKVWDFA